ncbi:MAG: kelch repeat-containing protein [Candidatus Acidiferrales bacterium]
MKRSLSLLISISGLCLLTACGGGTAPRATHFSVTAPASATAGTAFNFTVTALDASNRMTTNYSGTAHFTGTDGQALLPANSMLTNGLGTFSATLKSAGSQSITAIDTVTASITGTSSSINVAPGTASHFSVTAPGTANVGVAFNITVTALDAFNNTAASYTGTAHFTSTDGQAVLPANSMLTNGTGTFSVTPKTTGSQTITATDTITASITGTSSSISVTAAGPLAITSGAPPTGTAGKIYDLRFVPCQPGTLGCVCKSFPVPSCLRRISGFNFSATGGLAPYSWNWNPEAASSLPTGLNLSTNGIISGTPTEAGSFKVVVTVTDSESPGVQKSTNYTIVINLPPPPVINTMPAPISGTVNAPYSFTFTATSGLQPLGWSETGALPPGLSLSTGGVLSGTPTGAGSFPIIVTAQDSVGQNSAPQDFTIQIFAHGFVPTGTMETARSAATATLLNTGKVLVAGGADANGQPVAMAELYDPSNGTFSPTGSMETARANFAATLLPNGKVLVTGGLDTSGNPLATAELYDPTTGAFSATTGSMQFVHASHTATLLNTGKVLVAGWGNATAELFDPATGTFTATGSMVQPRVSHTATLLNSGKVLLTGGIQGAPPATTVLAEAELYDPTTGSFSQTLGGLATASQWHTATLLTDGMVLVTGGLDSTGNAIATAELFDLNNQSFTPTKGNMETPRAFQTATLLKDGTVLVTGGNNGTGPLATAELYDPTAGTFSPTGSMGAARQSHTATLLNDGTVLVTGGTNGAPLASAERYQ